MKKQIKCDECKHYVDKEDIQQVIYSEYETTKVPIRNYCPVHRKPYDFVSSDIYKEYKFLRRVGMIEVTSEGVTLEQEKIEQLEKQIAKNKPYTPLPAIVFICIIVFALAFALGLLWI